MTEKIPCRLCGSDARRVFQKRILGRHDVWYYLCSGCESLQTEVPYWLKEAYGPAHDRFDTGQVLRSLHNAAFLRKLMMATGLASERMVDYGCGSGLLVRVLRDVGIDAWGFEPIGQPRIALAYQTDDLRAARLVNLCEVVEHFDRPAESFQHVFSADPALVVVQTVPFTGPDPDWPYLGPEHGQHVFFYSGKAIGHIAQRYRRVPLLVQGMVLLADAELLPRLVEPTRNMLSPELLEALEGHFMDLWTALREHGYRHAREDLARLQSNQPQQD